MCLLCLGQFSQQNTCFLWVCKERSGDGHMLRDAFPGVSAISWGNQLLVTKITQDFQLCGLANLCSAAELDSGL